MLFSGPLLIVLEFAEGGTLLNHVKSNVTSILDGADQACSLPEEEKLQISLDIAKGMQYLAHIKVHYPSIVYYTFFYLHKAAIIAQGFCIRECWE
jgi:serine/threonine protein kinase